MNKGARFLLLMVSLVTVGGGSASKVSVRGGRCGGDLLGEVFVLGPRRRGDASSGVVARSRSFYRSALASILASPAGRGGEGRRRWLSAFCLWWSCCRWSSSSSLLRPAVVARGVVVGKLSGAAGGWLGRRQVGGKHGGSGKLVLWPSVFNGFGSVAGRRTALAVFYKAWRCSLPGGRRYGDSGEA